MPTPRKRGRRARGYGAAHQRLRRRLQKVVDAGTARCFICGGAILPGQPWDLGHTPDRSAWTGPEHPSCNRQEGGRRGGLTRRRKTSREW